MTLANVIMEAGSKDRQPIPSPVDACVNAKEMWIAIERLMRGENINRQDVETKLFWDLVRPLFDILKQHQNEVNELRAKRLAKTANPLALVATTHGKSSHNRQAQSTYHQ
ncbi:hypothetical protein Tco_0295159 [Tanacetum coccineum]